jgi:hypothetical protein
MNDNNDDDVDNDDDDDNNNEKTKVEEVCKKTKIDFEHRAKHKK